MNVRKNKNFLIVYNVVILNSNKEQSQLQFVRLNLVRPELGNDGNDIFEESVFINGKCFVFFFRSSCPGMVRRTQESN